MDSLYGLMKAAADASPEAVAIFGVGREPLRYCDLIRQIDYVVERLNGIDIGKADKVVTVLPNGPEAAVGCLAVASGAVCAPLNPAYSEAEFEFYLRDLAPKALIVSSEAPGPVPDIAHALGIRVLKLKILNDRPAGVFQLECDAEIRGSGRRFSGPDEVALVLYTTGTTSRPKMTLLKHAQLCRSARANRDCLMLGPEDCCLNVMPLFHIHGLTWVSFLGVLCLVVRIPANLVYGCSCYPSDGSPASC
jgi:acyl-CoA synthetase (AMP-forming)/AMP-acid ligase II